MFFPTRLSPFGGLLSRRESIFPFFEVCLGMRELKPSLIMLALCALLVGCSFAPVVAQGATTGFTVYITFFYPFHFLYNIRVTIYDQNGRIVATGLSPDGSMIIVPLRTETQIISLTAAASGYASGPFASYQASPSFGVVAGSSTVPVQINGGDYWVTVNLSP